MDTALKRAAPGPALDTTVPLVQFRMRLVSIEYYMAPPIKGMDVCYSQFQGTALIVRMRSMRLDNQWS